MSFTFYEAEEIARLNREEQMRAADETRIARRLRVPKEKRLLISTKVFEKLANLLLALGSHDNDQRAPSSSVPNQTPKSAVPRLIR